jgi:nicotinamidase-related amidase
MGHHPAVWHHPDIAEGKIMKQWVVRFVVGTLVALVAGIPVARAAAQTIIDLWAGVRAPEAPVLQTVTVDPKTTALLVGDFEKQTCAQVPRCLASLPAEAKLIVAARASSAAVIYSIVPSSTPADVLPAVARNANELYIQAGPDKFVGTDLDKLLTDRGVKTLIVTGTAAESTVLPTALHATQLGYDVIVPVDTMSSSLLYPEQYVAWDLTHAYGVRDKAKLTTVEMLSF